MGLVPLGAAALPRLTSIGVAISAVADAGRNGESAKRWGWRAALMMFLIPFCDCLPTLAAHRYDCITESGFWVDKTLDHWN